MIVNNSKDTLDTIWMQKITRANVGRLWIRKKMLNREGFSKPQHQRTFDIIHWMYIVG